MEKGTFPHAILLSGDNGIGKTTIARIIANELKAEVIEVDGSTFGRAEIMRDLAETVKYPPLGIYKTRMLIIDECHGLSKVAFDSWLKLVEEPPPYLYFAFCTTEEDKVVKGIKQRCQHFKLKPVATEEIEALVMFVSEEEGIKLPKGAETLIAKESQGSPRQALVFLSQVRNCETLEQVADILHSAYEQANIWEICKLIVTKRDMMRLFKMIFDLKDTSIYSLKILIVNYILGCIKKAKSETELNRFLAMLAHLSEVSTDPQFGFSELLVAIGNIYNERI